MYSSSSSSSSNPFENGTIGREVENGMTYYIVPSGFPLFKATKSYRETEGFHLDPSKPYFFGLKNMDPDYIESYEEEYGIIFEFVTRRPYRLLALDIKSTQEQLYRESPPAIQQIIQKNYGYRTNIRDSEPGPDGELAKYLCERGYEGYAIHTMPTHLGGIFHSEFLICDIHDGIELVRQVTTDDYKVRSILENERLKERERERVELRKKLRPGRSFIGNHDDDENAAPIRNRGRSLFGDDDDELVVAPNRNTSRGRSLFGDDDHEDASPFKKPVRRSLFDEEGGKRSYKKRKSIKKNKKTKSRKSKKTRKTRKKPKSK